MFGATTNYPFNFANRNGFPMIESANVTVNTDNVVIGIPRRAFRGLADSGIFAFRLTQEIPAANVPQTVTNTDLFAYLMMRIY